MRLTIWLVATFVGSYTHALSDSSTLGVLTRVSDVSPPVASLTSASKALECDMSVGMGVGDKDFLVDVVSNKRECIEKCFQKSFSDESINGVTRFSDDCGGQCGGCWCVQNMTRRDVGPGYYESCYLDKQDTAPYELLKTVIGDWYVTYINVERYDIAADGIIHGDDSSPFKIVATDEEQVFPTYDGWMKGIGGDGGRYLYLRLIEDGILELHYFGPTYDFYYKGLRHYYGVRGIGRQIGNDDSANRTEAILEKIVDTWYVTYYYQIEYTITREGFIDGQGNNAIAIVKSDNQQYFPSSDGWVKAVGDEDGEYLFLRLNKESVLEIHLFGQQFDQQYMGLPNYFGKKGSGMRKELLMKVVGTWNVKFILRTQYTISERGWLQTDYGSRYLIMVSDVQDVFPTSEGWLGAIMSDVNHRLYFRYTENKTLIFHQFAPNYHGKYKHLENYYVIPGVGTYVAPKAPPPPPLPDENKRPPPPPSDLPDENKRPPPPPSDLPEERFTPSPGPPSECIFRPGDGVGGEEVFIGEQKGKECIEACKSRRSTDSAINGVTVYSDTTIGGCWCEKNMKNRNNEQTYMSCILPVERSTPPPPPAELPKDILGTWYVKYFYKETYTITEDARLLGDSNGPFQIVTSDNQEVFPAYIGWLKAIGGINGRYIYFRLIPGDDVLELHYFGPYRYEYRGLGNYFGKSGRGTRIEATTPPPPELTKQLVGYWDVAYHSQYAYEITEDAHLLGDYNSPFRIITSDNKEVFPASDGWLKAIDGKDGRYIYFRLIPDGVDLELYYFGPSYNYHYLGLKNYYGTMGKGTRIREIVPTTPGNNILTTTESSGNNILTTTEFPGNNILTTTEFPEDELKTSPSPTVIKPPKVHKTKDGKKSDSGKKDKLPVTTIVIGVSIIAVCSSLLAGAVVGLNKYQKSKRFGPYLQPNPNYKINEEKPQVNELGYDLAWEISRSRVQLKTIINDDRVTLVWMAEIINIEEILARRKQEWSQNVTGNTKTTVIVKGLSETASDKDMKNLATEIKILIYLGDHPNIVNLLGACTRGSHQPIYAIKEYCKHGNLKNYLTNNKDKLIFVDDLRSKQNLDECITTFDMMKMCVDIAQGMAFLHSKMLIHPELAATNILVADDYSMKLSGFLKAGSTWDDDENSKDYVSEAPIEWLSPESIQDKTFTQKTDVWTFGVLMWEIFSFCTTPYSDVKMTDLTSFLKSEKRLKKPPLCPDEMFDAMMQCWTYISEDRPSMKDVLTRLNEIMESNGSCYEFKDNSDVTNSEERKYYYIEDVHFLEKGKINNGMEQDEKEKTIPQTKTCNFSNDTFGRSRYAKAKDFAVAVVMASDS